MNHGLLAGWATLALAGGAHAQFVADAEYRASGVLAAVHASAAYELGITGRGVLLGVIDTGIQPAHREFRRAYVGGYNAFTDTPGLTGPDFHGSHVSGILAARRDGAGMHGVAYASRFLVAAAVGGFLTPPEFFARAARSMTASGARIVNNSWGLGPSIEAGQSREDYLAFADLFGARPVLTAFQELAASDAVIVFGNGNNGTSQPDFTAGMPLYFPGLRPHWINVAALAADGRIAAYSSRCGLAAAWCVTAPGTAWSVDGFTARGYREASGTSMAAPVVSGVVALVAERFPWMTAPQLVGTVLTTAADGTAAEFSPETGRGLVDVRKAMRGPAALEFAWRADTRGHAATWSNAISGTGSLVKAGAGTLRLAGANTFAGPTTVEGGTLLLEGSLASATRVGAGGTLAGNGRIAGPLTFAPGSVYSVAARADGSTRHIRLGPAATAKLRGGTVAVQASGNGYAPLTRYTILHARAGVTGAFERATSNLLFLTPTLSYDASNVYLDLRRNDVSFVSAASAPNEAAVAAALARVFDADTHDAAMVRAMNAVLGLSRAQAGAAYRSMAGAGHQAAQAAPFSVLRGVHDLLAGRLAAGGGTPGLQPALLAAAGPASDAPAGAWMPRTAAYGPWVSAAGVAGSTSGDGNAAGFSTSGQAIGIGADAEIAPNLRAGLALVRGSQHQSFDGSADDNRLTTHAGAAYGELAAGPWSLKAVVGYGRSDVRTRRVVAVGAVGGLARASYTGRQASAYGEVARSWVLAGGDELQPVLALEHLRSRTPAYTERGAGPLNLAVGAEERHSTRSHAGVRYARRFGDGDFRLQGRLLWWHEFGDADRGALNAGFAAAGPAATFSVRGVDLPRDGLTLGTTLTGRIGRHAHLFLDVGAEVRRRQWLGAATAGLRYAW
ncbi:MAG: autotransporter domain-containing protein [Ramlibacter sp.]